uniref:Uncharacterized protein n=1 Tax=Rhizophagus irregularis (strain DAOM 181602 / DAOM 197198 / MUCL 43194) TaxID=747089 RepID=U9TLL5_RHIID
MIPYSEFRDSLFRILIIYMYNNYLTDLISIKKKYFLKDSIYRIYQPQILIEDRTSKNNTS